MDLCLGAGKPDAISIMTTFYLVRHGDNDVLPRAIAGRSPGVHLNASGHAQAQCLAERLAKFPIRQIFSSPMERARQTAEPLAERLGLRLEISEPLNELDFGDWTLQTFADLERLEGWKQWNVFRSAGRIPNGETMIRVQERMVTEMQRLYRAHPNDSIALFSHADPLRAAILYFLGMPLDFIHRLQLGTASVSVLSIDNWSARLTGLNLLWGVASS
jgi:broad specificity phosphatase PhoE